MNERKFILRRTILNRVLRQIRATHSQLVPYATTKCFAPSILAFAVLVMPGTVFAGRTLPEYTAAEAKKHIGETARVTDRVGCAAANRNGGYNVGLGDCDGQTPFWVVTHGDIAGPKLDVSQLKGVVITVTGKIEKPSDVARIFVTSTSQIVVQREPDSKQPGPSSDEKRPSDSPEERDFQGAKAEYEHSSRDEAARVRYVTKLAGIRAQLTPKILHNSDVNAKAAYAGQAAAVDRELGKHPAPGNTDSKALSQLLVGKWQSPRHVYVFRADGTYGMADTEQRDKWRIDGNEYIDDVSRGPIILLDQNHFIYGSGQGVIIYTRASSPSSPSDDKSTDSAIKQKIVGYWKFPKAVCYIAADGKMYVGPRKNETEKSRWDVKNGKFYWDNVTYTIVTLTDNTFVFREIGPQGATLTLIRSTKEEVAPE
jgi:hypothetical protein